MDSRPAVLPPTGLLPSVSPRGSSVFLGADRPPRHDAPASQSPVAGRRKREADASFPRSELWSWSMGDDASRQLKDDVIENMLRECSTTAGIGSMSAAPLLPSTGSEQRRVHQHFYPLQANGQQAQSPAGPQAQRQSTPSGSRRKLPTKALASSRNLSAVPPLTPGRDSSSASGGGGGSSSRGSGGGWRTYKLAHRTNRLMSRTRKFIDAFAGEGKTEEGAPRSRGSSIHTGDPRSHRRLGDPSRASSESTGGNDDAQAECTELVDDTSSQMAIMGVIDCDEESEHVLAARLKLQAASEMFRREVLNTPEDELEASSTHWDLGADGDDFWRIYHASTTSKRPDSARGRYISKCEDASLLVLPVLDLKNKPRRYAAESQTLRYDDYYLGDKRAQALGDALHLLPESLQSLSIKNVGVTGVGSSAIIDGIALAHLNHLNLSENRLGADGTDRIFAALGDPHVNLRSLDLGNNQLGDAAVRALVECLLNRCTLEHLDLRRNRIYLAARAIGELLRISTPLKTLNLSWNNIRGEPAQYLARSMMENLTLTSLDLSDNTLGNGGSADAELGACLASNKTLRHLDISNNHVRGRALLVYVNGLQQNAVGSALETLVLRGNPIGSLGAESVLRAAASGAVAKCQIDIGRCNLELIDESSSSNSTSAAPAKSKATMTALSSVYGGGGSFTVSVRERADAALLKELLMLFYRSKLEVVDAMLNGVPFVSVLASAKAKGDEKAILNAVPGSGLLQIKVQPNYERREEPVSARGFEAVLALLSRSFGALEDGDEAAKLLCIRLLADEFTFSVDQANELLALFRSHTTQVEKASAAAALIPQIVVSSSNTECRQEVLDCANMEVPDEFFEDKDRDGKIDACGDICVVLGLEKHLSDLEQSYVEKKVGKWVSFNASNPTGRYALNMAQSIDRRILLRILEFNKNEKRLRQQLKLTDVSQCGPSTSSSALAAGGFRNVRLNRMPVDVGAPWEFPLLGVLEFDFASSRRPVRACTALSDAAFDQFLKEFKQLQVPAEVKLIGLRSVSTLYYFSSAQTQRLMEHFGTFERDPGSGGLLRAEVLVVLFSRIVDEWNLGEALALLDLATKAQVLDRLGWLNCFHPLQQAESYKQLRLRSYEHRQLVLVLVRLAVSGEIELSSVMLSTSEGSLGSGGAASAPGAMAVESEQWKAWVADDKLPSDGEVSCSMRATSPASAQPEAQLPPSSVRKKLLQSMLLKLDDKMQEPAA